MREVATEDRIRAFLRRLGESVTQDTRIYLTGGATAVLLGWRDSTIDVDLKIVPDWDEVLQAVARLKEELQINVELASPDQFIPPLPRWESRSLWISREGRIEWFHFDLYSQALAKIERDHAQDREDVRAMLSRGLVDRVQLRELFDAIRPSLFRYPAIEPEAFARRVRHTLDAPIA